MLLFPGWITEPLYSFCFLYFLTFPHNIYSLVIFDFVSVFDFAIYFALDDYKSKLGCEDWLFKIWFMK